jgi:hypothetical protein
LQSGKQEEDYINDATAAYEEHYKIQLKFRDCLEHLWTSMPTTFDPMVEAEADEFDEELNISNRDDDSDFSGVARVAGVASDFSGKDYNKVGRVQGSNLQHPHGKKHAQKMIAQEKIKVQIAIPGKRGDPLDRKVKEIYEY